MGSLWFLSSKNETLTTRLLNFLHGLAESRPSRSEEFLEDRARGNGTVSTPSGFLGPLLTPRETRDKGAPGKTHRLGTATVETDLPVD